MITGNSCAIELTRRAFQSSDNPILLYGPGGVGKRSFALSLVSDYAQESVYTIDGRDGVDKFRGILKESSIKSSFSNINHILIDNLELASDSTKDLLLKYLEEPHYHTKIVVISAEPHGISPALLSRFRVQIKWSPLSKEDLFGISKDELAVSLSRGSFSVFNSIYGDAKAKQLYDDLINSDWPSIAISSRIPEILSMKGVGEDRKTAISNIFWLAAKKSKYSLSFLRLSSLIVSRNSVNIQNHYVSEAALCIAV